jgi:predicted nuclease of predicted toxin-antitoxin system
MSDLSVRRTVTIWEWAKQNIHTIVTTDSDLVTLSGDRGWPPKVVHLEECDFPLRIIEELFRQNAVRISEFDTDPHTGILALRFAPDPRCR